MSLERTQAKVISGNRGDRSTTDVAKANPILKIKTKPGYTTFKAKARKYVLQYTAPQLVTLDPQTGRKVNSNPEAIRFENNVYSTNDEKKIEFMLTRKAFGLGRDFWLLEDEQQVIVRDSAKGLLGQLQVIDPKLIPADIREKIIASLGADVRKDFTPPPAK